VLFEETQNVNNLQSGDTETLTFSAYNLSTPNALYKVEVSTQLTNDEDAVNNTLQKNIYTYTHDRNQVLLEIGTGTWCHYCIGAAMGAEDLIDNDHDVAVIEYHSNDSFSTITGEDRINFYGMAGFPDAFFDGITEYGGGSENSLYNTYLPLYQTHKDIKTGVDINITQSFSNNQYSVNVELNKVGPIADDNLAVYLVLTESDITFTWQGQPKLDFVQRLTLPDANGETVDLINNTNLTIPFTFQLDNTWTNDLELIAFVQNKTTKEVLNTAKLSLSNSTGFIATDDLSNKIQIYPNPTSKWLIINDFSKSVKQLVITDMAGKNILQINNFKNKKQIDISGLQKGIYLIKINSNNHTIITKKLIKN